ncbi:TPA: hypothetical protein HA344_08835 [Candidatus Bathyarchaeota archaeon]|nr:hypothetical protein [Candidatus Bathyarchaeota archaeon]
MQSPNPCSDIADNTLDLLRDAAKMQMGKGLDQDSEMMEKVKKKTEERLKAQQQKREQLKEQLEQLKAKMMMKAVEKLLEGASEEEVLSELELTGEMEGLEEQIEQLDSEPHAISEEDFDEALKDLEKKGLLDGRGKGVILTSKGAQLLGRGFLSRILMNLARKGLGAHRVEDIGHGPWLAATYRPYEPGDPYDRINVERSLMAAIERGGGFSEMKTSDFRIHESRHATEVHFGVLVDQSASMKKKGKMEAAVETALALSELMRLEFPEDRLRVYAFSEETKMVEPYELPGVVVPQQFTDIRRPLRAFRLAVAMEPGNKQAHLITDSAPNFIDGEFVGFKKAMEAVIEEVRLYRLHDILLNVVMLDDDPELREMAKRIAQVNNGRVFFADPQNLGEALVEDYLWSKKEILSL